MQISRRKFSRISISGCGMPQNFIEKTFADGSRALKFVKVFSLKSFPLYGIQLSQINSITAYKSNPQRNTARLLWLP